ncbi:MULTISPECIES: rhodanese-like domain-containing protein [Filomicrobium]|uniref:Thiosulfate sulfurtransferase n=1 Tax=Filomicrobium insigne TaxID=418854 RepID=A0A1H0IME0_9HYPH|nr:MULTISPECIES: rhodanese-like domain-containing protein [Filomicrobium]MCV0368289.1 rhodanese-like domain-containing protein [Filomicrobium sp.]SDO32654.1 thiosulfate sulfurtransferase [Filomicrobium insigne]
MGSCDSIHIEDVSVEEAWARLSSEADTILIDVRTRAEWAFVGLPDLSNLGKQVVRIEWQSFPENQVDAAFSERLSEFLSSAGIGKDAELLFICRSGSRSRHAAEVMAAQGYQRCRNVADGFEGPLDAHRHRGTQAGWKAAGLPWVQG